MEPLSDQQVDIILNRIIADGVTECDLQNGLLDHYCCFIEERLSAGTDFETAYRQAFDKIGAQEIQEELNYILTLNQKTIMKSIIYGCGFLAVFCLSTGTMFRTMHWAGTPVFMFSGYLLLIITSIALLSNAMKYMKNHTASYKIRMVIGFIAALLIAIGGIFKVLSYPTANLQMMLGMALFNFVFLPMFFFHLYREAKLNTSAV